MYWFDLPTLISKSGIHFSKHLQSKIFLGSIQDVLSLQNLRLKTFSHLTKKNPEAQRVVAIPHAFSCKEDQAPKL